MNTVTKGPRVAGRAAPTDRGQGSVVAPTDGGHGSVVAPTSGGHGSVVAPAGARAMVRSLGPVPMPPPQTAVIRRTCRRLTERPHVWRGIVAQAARKEDR